MHDHIGNAKELRQLPHLCLEQIAERIDWRRIIGMPGEVPKQPLRFVAGTDRKGVILRRLIEQHDHSLARHHVSATRGIGVFFVRQVAVDGGRDVDRPPLDAELVDDELRVSERVGARGPIRHSHCDDVFRSECLRR